jgi:hypothetical protein
MREVVKNAFLYGVYYTCSNDVFRMHVVWLLCRMMELWHIPTLRISAASFYFLDIEPTASLCRNADHIWTGGIYSRSNVPEGNSESSDTVRWSLRFVIETYVLCLPTLLFHVVWLLNQRL